MTSKTSGDDDAAALSVLEASMMLRHKAMYADLHSGSKEVDGFDRRAAAYNREVDKYSAAVLETNARKLASLGGFAAALGKLHQAPPPPPTPRVQALPAGILASQQTSEIRRTGVAFGVSLDAIVSADEAETLVTLSEQLTYRHIVKRLSTNYTQVLPERTNVRCVVHDAALAAHFWPLVRDHVPASFQDRSGTWVARRLNPCFRFCKYEPGQLFAAHTDDVYRSRDGMSERSFVTFVLYLNDGYAGGTLRFLRSRWGTRGQRQADNVLAEVVPTAGQCLLFQHDLLHEAMPPSGPLPKYLVRTDVVYSNKSKRR